MPDAYADSYLREDVRKFGVSNFSIEVIDTGYGRQDLIAKEDRWIKALGCRHPHGYNRTLGGN